MKKILIVQETLVGGGAERVLVDTLNKFDYSKYDVELLLLRKQGIYLNSINKNVKVRYIFGDFDSKKGLNRIISWKIYNLICRFFSNILVNKYMKDNYDVVIGFLEGFSSLLVSQYKKNSKKIVWVHSDLKKLKTITNDIDKDIYNKVDEIVCVSQDSKKSLMELYPEITNKINVIYNIIDKESIKLKSEEKVTDINFDKFTLIGVGRLNIEKRFDVMIKAFKILKNENINAQLIILGEGPEEKELRNLIDKLELVNDVRIIGFKSNPYKYIKKADIFVMSSDFEGLPVVLCESLVLGKAIVATNCTGPAELLDYGKYGVLCDCDNPEALANSIKSLIEDDDKRHAYSLKSLERSKIFDENKVLKEIYSLINK